MPQLNELRIGERARITVVGGDLPLVQRLLEMGIMEGEEIQLIRHAPLGDPLEIEIRDARISLRRREAAGIQVLILSPT